MRIRRTLEKNLNLKGTEKLVLGAKICQKNLNLTDKKIDQ
jgi:hypothetical protein